MIKEGYLPLWLWLWEIERYTVRSVPMYYLLLQNLYDIPVQAMNIIPYPRFVVVDTDSLKKEKKACKKIFIFF